MYYKFCTLLRSFWKLYWSVFKSASKKRLIFGAISKNLLNLGGPPKFGSKQQSCYVARVGKQFKQNSSSQWKEEHWDFPLFPSGPAPQGLASFLLLYGQTFPAGSMAAYPIPPPRWNCKIWRGQGCVLAPLTLTMLSHGHFSAVQLYKACTLLNLYHPLSMFALEHKVLQLANTHQRWSAREILHKMVKYNVIENTSIIYCKL